MSMRRIQASQARGRVLDWLVAKCEGCELSWDEVTEDFYMGLDSAYCFLREFTPSSNWGQGGPIIEREWEAIMSSFKAKLAPLHGDQWPDYMLCGENVLTAYLRCWVEVKLGDQVEVPEEML